jgi:hypothetical protein
MRNHASRGRINVAAAQNVRSDGGRDVVARNADQRACFGTTARRTERVTTVLVREEKHPRSDQRRREEQSGADNDLPISRALRIRGTRQNVGTDHLRQNVGPSRRGDSARTAHLRPAGERI